MKPRFEPHTEPAGNPPPSRLIDPEAYDASEQRFAASLDAEPSTSRFVVDDRLGSLTHGGETAAAIPRDQEAAEGDASGIENVDFSNANSLAHDTAEEMNLSPLGDSWRAEVAAKMNRYRAQKRPRAPRYPSLQLKFEALDSGAAVRALPVEHQPAPIQGERPEARSERPVEQLLEAEVIQTGKILEFPAPFLPQPPTIDELAEPVFDRPRILEVPEVVPPPPALGGILIEPAEEPARERRQGFELPLIAAPFSRRILAGAIDALIVGIAFVLFAWAFFRISAVVPEIRLAASLSIGLLAVFWAGYQYLMLVHAGATAGLKLAKLRLSRFDGSQVPVKLRRWRVLASLLSGLSLGLGYAWCFLDEDQLCWHDRITHTYMAPTSSH